MTFNHCALFVASFTISILGAGTSVLRADIIGFGGSVELAEPPSSILLGEWESDTEIRGWFEREITLTSDLMLGHVNPGLVNDLSQLVNGTITAETTVRSYLVREDPVDDGPIGLTGFLAFDTPILGVFIGNQLGSTDALLGRPGVVHNQNSYRGLELDVANDTGDSFEISEDRLRIDFAMEVAEWTDDIRIVTAVPEPAAVVLLGFGSFLAVRRRR